MSSREFCYWLQGFFEINSMNPNARPELNDAQIKTIQNHLNLVFHHEIDPSYGGDQPTMQAIHDGKPKIGKMRC